MNEEQFRTGKGVVHAPHGIDDAFRDVRQFHKTFDHPHPPLPTMQPADRVEARAQWMESEINELREATTVTKQADAYLDVAYFAIGGLVELGVSPGELWKIVQKANMSKVHEDGKVYKREDGKVIKPPHWIDPDPLLIEAVEKMTTPLD